MCTRQFSFTDLFNVNLKKIDHSYFQPHVILQGLNKFHINRETFEVKEIKNIISLKTNEKCDDCKFMHI
jgi:hypothetical protein